MKKNIGIPFCFILKAVFSKSSRETFIVIMSVTPLKKAKRIKSIDFSFRLLVKGNIKTKIDPDSDPEHKLQGS